ncbi:MAG: hypothetical protein ACLQQ4_17705 [Bacteroidia bacterium]
MKTLTYNFSLLRIRFIAIVLLCLFMTRVSYAQNTYNYKQYIFPGSALFLSGMIDGTIESISFHYEGFKHCFPNANDQYWNPALSWTNKYKDGNPSFGPKFMGSTGTFVCFTDAYHGLRTCKNIINTGTIAFYLNRVRCSSEKVKMRKVIIDALILTAIRNIGFYTTYSLLFRTTGNN